jgi:uncharacterized membrane protein YeaQ/YmgE (transglycosylase-associated protein family)
MMNLLVWAVYGLFVGSIAKSLVPGEENFGFVKTVALGVAGSYMGGAMLYLLGQYSSVSPAGIFAGVAGGDGGVVVSVRCVLVRMLIRRAGLRLRGRFAFLHVVSSLGVGLVGGIGVGSSGDSSCVPS